MLFAFRNFTIECKWTINLKNWSRSIIKWLSISCWHLSSFFIDASEWRSRVANYEIGKSSCQFSFSISFNYSQQMDFPCRLLRILSFRCIGRTNTCDNNYCTMHSKHNEQECPMWRCDFLSASIEYLYSYNLVNGELFDNNQRVVVVLLVVVK